MASLLVVGERLLSIGEFAGPRDAGSQSESN